MHLSKFHNKVSHASRRLFVRDLEHSRAFYEKLGFVWVWSVVDYYCYLRMGTIYIELWKNEMDLTDGGLQDANGKVYPDPALVITVRDVSLLGEIDEDLKAEGVATDTTEINNDSSAWGENLQVTDPDGHLILFRSLIPLSGMF